MLDVFAAKNIPVFNCDLEVKSFLEHDKDIIEEISYKFHNVVKDGKINRNHLAEVVFKDKQKRKQLEKIIYPKLLEKQDDFMEEHGKTNSILVAEVPLLYEKNLDKYYDLVIVTTSSKKKQIERAEKRGIDKQRLEIILKNQFSDQLKRSNADYTVNTSKSKEEVTHKINYLIKRLREKYATNYSRH